MTITLSNKTKKYFLSTLVNKESNESFVVRLLTTKGEEPHDKKYGPSYISSFEWEISGKNIITALSNPQIFMFEGGSKEIVKSYFVETDRTQQFLFDEEFSEPIDVNSGGSIAVILELELKGKK